MSICWINGGVSPNIDFLKESGIEINRGIMVDEYLQTSVIDIYAAGDCAEFRKPIGEREYLSKYGIWKNDG